MKLATYLDGSRDGQLVVVSRDLSQAHYTSGIAGRLQIILDDWNFYAPQLLELSSLLESGRALHSFAFDPARCLCPMPRAYQLLQAQWSEDGSWSLAQCPSDNLLGHAAPLDALSGCQSSDLGGAIAVFTSDVTLGASPDKGHDSIRLITLANTFYNCQGAGGVPTPVATCLGPVVVTPDELGAAWKESKVELVLSVSINGRKLGLIEMGQMRATFGELIALAAAARPLTAGTIVCSGCVLNRIEQAHGFASLALKRQAELCGEGQSISAWLQPGDQVRLEIKGLDGVSVFGALEHRTPHLQTTSGSPGLERGAALGGKDGGKDRRKEGAKEST